MEIIVLFQKAKLEIKDPLMECVYEDFITDFAKKNGLLKYPIYSYQINLNDNSNLMAWAQEIDILAKRNKVLSLIKIL